MRLPGCHVNPANPPGGARLDLALPVTTMCAMMLPMFRTALCSALFAAVAVVASATGESTVSLTLCCSAENDLYRVLVLNGVPCRRADGLEQGVDAAPAGTGVLLLADHYPDGRNPVTTTALERARAKRLRLYLEFPDQVPGVAFDAVTTIKWERAVVTTSSLGASLPALRILTVSGARYLPTTTSRALLSIARVAGYDRALFGVPDSARPLLFQTADGTDTLVATTALSHFVTGRYAPAHHWCQLWSSLLSRLAGAPIGELRAPRNVRPAYSATDTLPAQAERESLNAAAGWLVDSRLLVSAARQPEIVRQLRFGAADAPIPGPSEPIGDGTYGILEGYASYIDHDGTQRQVIPLRADCQAESAMLLAMDAAVSGNDRHATIARNLLNFTYGASGLTGGVRADPNHGAYGLISWGAVAPAWDIANYGDDNARAILGTWAGAALLGAGDWDEPLLRAIAANFRTTGKFGFRGDRIDNPQLAEKGWKHFADREVENFAGNFEACLWNCYLAAYQQTRYEPFLTRTREGISRMMRAYPNGWRWLDGNERSRMVFTLAWLVRVDDTPQHREWLHTVARGLLETMQPCGAIADRLARGGGGHYQVPQSNEAYGTGESPLIQANGDPVSDQLYTSGFALIGLHEAAAATGEAYLKEAEDRLAQYLVRIQVRSDAQPYLSGAWLRAFDFELWDFWGSAGDIGWGPWCAETGWGQTWIGAALGLRQRGETLWDLLQKHPVSDKWGAIQKEMLPAGGI